MHVDDIRRLVKLVEESEIDSLEVRRWWTVIRITKRGENHSGETTIVVPQAPSVAVPVAPAPTPVAPLQVALAPDPGGGASASTSPADEGLVEIRSPMVGTFYRAASPEMPPYADVGTRVEKGQVVCIVEAMKLMNEIESEVSGTISRIPVENATPVEFNQPLFLVKPD